MYQDVLRHRVSRSTQRATVLSVVGLVDVNLPELVANTRSPLSAVQVAFAFPYAPMPRRVVRTRDRRNLPQAVFQTAHPALVGTHWFQWLDQPATGRNDGENYNIGLVDVTDQAYAEMVAAAKLTHGRLYEVHNGATPPVTRRARASAN